MDSNLTTHITNINPFENKEWGAYFNKVVCLFIEVRHYNDYVSVYMHTCIFVYVNICGYTKLYLIKKLTKDN